MTIGLAIAFTGIAHAKTPPEVLKPYKDYRAALESGDDKSASKYAYEAWQKAETLIGDSKITGDLALNFAKIKSENKKIRKKAFQRSMELVSYYNEDVETIYLERGIDMMNFHHRNGYKGLAYNLAKDLSEYAETNQLNSSTFYGEALTYRAGYLASKGKHEQVELIASQALDAFKKRADGIETVQPVIANLYQGYGFEGQNKSMEAALSYQKVMEALDGIQADDHPLAAKALGRWTQMRGVLVSEGRLEEAESKGLCKCWPYDVERNENIKPIKRVPPKMPRNAWVSGFSIVKFNLSDEGRPVDEEILVSWPEGLYEKSSLVSLRRWEYTPRTAGEKDVDRQGLISTISYRLTDRSGDIIY